MSDKEEQIITKKKSDPDRESVFGHGFADIIDSYDWDETLRLVAEASDEDVRRVLAKAERNRKALTPEEFAILISEAADPYLEQMAELAHRFTLERFGKTISMYIPMYVSNACTNKCVYCGFNHDNPFTRTTLTMEQIEEECKAIKRLGPFENLLIVSENTPRSAAWNIWSAHSALVGPTSTISPLRFSLCGRWNMNGLPTAD